VSVASKLFHVVLVCLVSRCFVYNNTQYFHTFNTTLLLLLLLIIIKHTPLIATCFD